MRCSAVRLAFLALAIAGCDAAPESAVAPSLDKVKDGIPDKQHVTQPFSATVNNPCPPVPEMVLVEGTGRFHSHFKFFDGGNTMKSMVTTQAQGIGATTGVRYTFHEKFSQSGLFHYDDMVFHADQLTRWHVVSATGLGNFFATTHQKVTCPPSGVCSVEPIVIETDCRG
jgi:hypothetical protein